MTGATNHRNPSWAPEHSDKLKVLHVAGLLSFDRMATAINEEFGTRYTRNAVIGRAGRMGLVDRLRRKPDAPPRLPRKPKAPREHKPRVRIVRANGNSNGLRVTTASETEQYKLRCVEIEPRHLALMDLNSGDCRYPYGEGPYTFCGHPKMEGASYCTPHFHLCRQEARVSAGDLTKHAVYIDRVTA